MKLFPSYFKLYCRSPVLSIPTFLLFGFAAFATPIQYAVYYTDGAAAPLYLLSFSLMVSYALPLIYMFVGYEFGFKTKAVALEECITSIQNGSARCLLAQGAVLLLMSGIPSLLLLLEHIVFYFLMQVNSGAYLWLMVQILFLNIFLVSLTSAVIGMATAKVLKRVPAYLFIILFTLFGVGVLNLYFNGIYNNTGFNLYPVLDLFSIIVPSLKATPNTHFGYSVLSYQYQRLGLWAFLSLALLLWKIAPKRKTWLRPVAALSLAACMVCTVFYYLPASKVNMDGDHPDSSTLPSYYLNHDAEKQKEEEGGFQVTAYDLDLQIGRQLTTTAVLTIDQPDLPEYKFTLSHSYKVQSVTDQTGTELQVEQNEDYVSVIPAGQPVEQLTFIYQGHDPQFYTNRQGVFLPGQFYFFPHSGYHKTVAVDSGIVTYYKDLLPADTYFHVTTNASNPIFSNLEQQGDGAFTGTADSLTLLSGMLTSIEIDGIEVIYPYLEMEEYTPEMLKEELETLMAQKKDDRVYKKVFLTPNMNCGNRIAAFGDYLNATYLYDIMMDYEKEFVLPQKHDLFDVVWSYQYDADHYQTILESAEFWAENEVVREEDQTIIRFEEALQTIGEEALLTKCNAYFADGSDQRDSLTFLQALKEEQP